MPIISVVMPAYNEELTISDAIEDVIKHVVAITGDAEFIIVDDGSRDQTAAIVRKLREKHRCIHLLQQANGGHGPALRAGIEAATGDWLLLLDSDCQVDLAAFAEHWRARESFDVFLGIRSPRHDPFFRLVISWWMKRALSLFARVAPLDAGAPYKIISRNAWTAARPWINSSSWIPSVLLAAFVLQDKSLRVVQRNIKHNVRPNGESTLNAKRLIRFCWFAMYGIIAFGRALSTRGTDGASSTNVASQRD